MVVVFIHRLKNREEEAPGCCLTADIQSPPILRVVMPHSTLRLAGKLERLPHLIYRQAMLAPQLLSHACRDLDMRDIDLLSGHRPSRMTGAAEVVRKGSRIAATSDRGTRRSRIGRHAQAADQGQAAKTNAMRAMAIREW